jgi:hypothetical protein
MNSSAIVWAGTLGASCVIFLACWQPWKPRPRHSARAVEQAIARGQLTLPPPLVGSMQLREDWDWQGPGDWPGPGRDEDEDWARLLRAELDAIPVTSFSESGADLIRRMEDARAPVQGPAGAQPCDRCRSLPVPIIEGTPPVLARYGPACGCDERLAETGDLAAVARRLDYDAEIEQREVSHAAFMAELSYAWDRLKAASFHITIEKGNRR